MREIIESIPLQAAIFFFMGIICLAVAAFTSGNKLLKQKGIHVDGIIYSVDGGSTVNVSNVKDKIVVRFLTEKQVWITGPLRGGFLIFYSGQYKLGEQVKVVYDPENPANFILETEQPELLGRVVFLVVGIILGTVGVYQYLSSHY